MIERKGQHRRQRQPAQHDEPASLNAENTTDGRIHRKDSAAHLAEAVGVWDRQRNIAENPCGVFDLRRRRGCGNFSSCFR